MSDRIDRLIDDLVLDARPVGRLWSPARRLGAWLFVVAAATALGLRHDAARPLGTAALAEIVCLGVAAVAAAWIALRAAVPGLDGRGRALLPTSIAAGLVLSLLRTTTGGMPLVDFVAAGMPCAVASIVLSALPAATLVWAVDRGAALRPASAGAAAGLAAAIWTYLLMHLRCRLDDTAHVLVWHGVPVLLVTAVSAAVAVLVARARRATALPA